MGRRRMVMTTVTIIVEHRAGEIRIRHHGPRTLHPGDVVCVELRDYGYIEGSFNDYPGGLFEDESGHLYAGGLQMRLEVLP
jgi:hypothetical protein